MKSLARRYRRLAADIIPDAWYSPWTPTEAEFQRLFLRLARVKGWRWYHTFDSRRSNRGFPDLCMVNPSQRRILFVELKGWTGQATDEQRDWLRDLNDAGGEAYLVQTSGDYARDAASIVELLTTRPIGTTTISGRGVRRVEGHL